MQVVKTHALDGGHTHILTTNQTYHYFPKHYHETYSIAMLIHGVKDFHTNTDGGILHKCNIATMNPYEVHYGHSVKEEGWKQLVILFDEHSTGKFAEENELKRKTLEFSESVKEDTPLRSNIQNICMNVVTAETDLEKDHYLEMLMAEIYSNEKMINISSPYINKRGIGKTVSLMNDTPAAKLSLQELAETAGMSKFHYLRSFKAATGLTPHAYLNITRVEKARRYLITTDKSITEIAHECGFADQAHLTRAYKKIYGTTPGTLYKY